MGLVPLAIRVGRFRSVGVAFLGLALITHAGCDYRWTDTDREQTRQMLVRSIGLPTEAGAHEDASNIDVSTGSADVSEKNQIADRPNAIDQEPNWKKEAWVDPDSLPSHQWEIIYIGNQPVGYTRRSIEYATAIQRQLVDTSVAESQQSLLCIEAESRVRISRKSGEPIDQKVLLTTIEKPDGELLGIRGSIDTGVTKRVFKGIVKSGVLEIERNEDKVITTSSVPWEPANRGPFAIEQSLRGRPMKPGDVRTVRYLDPFQMAITESRLEALSDGDTVDFEGALTHRTEIENRSITQGRTSNSLMWTDDKGVVRKTYAPGVDRQTYDCDPVTARYVISKEEFDATIPKELPLFGNYAKVSETGVAVFRIASDLLREEGRISNRTNQKLLRVNERTWDIEVMNADSFDDASNSLDPVVESTRASAGLIEWKDPIVQRWLNNQKSSSAFEASDTTRVADQVRGQALAGRGWVAKAISRTAMDKTLQSAAMTLRDRKGDCIDHAILLATVLRGLDIPTRVAIGFRAEPSTVRPTCRFYAWVEYHDTSRWIPIDSYIDTDTVPPDRIKISESALTSINAYDPLLGTLRLIPDVEISARTRKP